jgi:hypothetical protein
LRWDVFGQRISRLQRPLLFADEGQF